MVLLQEGVGFALRAMLLAAAGLSTMVDAMRPFRVSAEAPVPQTDSYLSFQTPSPPYSKITALYSPGADITPTATF